MAQGQRADSGTENLPRPEELSDFTPSTVSSPASSPDTHRRTCTHAHSHLRSLQGGPLVGEKREHPLQHSINSSPDTNGRAHTHSHTESQTQRQPETHTPTRNHPNRIPRHTHARGTPRKRPGRSMGVDTNIQTPITTPHMPGNACHVPNACQALHTYVTSHPVGSLPRLFYRRTNRGLRGGTISL